MNIYYDCEFLEDGQVIELISVGMIRDDGPEYYAVSSEMPVKRIYGHPWLMKNAVPSLPLKDTHSAQLIRVDVKASEVKPRQVIANEVRDFILAVPEPSLWGWYCAYDHVLLAQLFGRMTDLPEGIPMHSNDLKQEADRASATLPPMPGCTEHHALADAREIRYRYHWLQDSCWGSCPCFPFGDNHCKVT